MSINSKELKNIIKKYNKQIKVELIEDDEKSLSDQGMDSLDIIDILLCIEEELDLKIPDEDSIKLLSINDYVNYINSNLEK